MALILYQITATNRSFHKSLAVNHVNGKLSMRNYIIIGHTAQCKINMKLWNARVPGTKKDFILQTKLTEWPNAGLNEFTHLIVFQF